VSIAGAIVEILQHLVILLFILDRSELGISLGAVPHLDCLRIGNELRQHSVVDTFVNVETLGGIAELRIVLERSPEQLRGN
jgi:hypothetical protein